MCDAFGFSCYSYVNKKKNQKKRVRKDFKKEKKSFRNKKKKKKDFSTRDIRPLNHFSSF